MASATGAWGGRNQGNNRGRLRIVTSQSPSSVGSGTSSVTLTIDVYLQTEYATVWNGFSVSISGALSWSGSANVSHGSGGGETRIARRTLTVPTQYAQSVSRSFTASISGLTLFPTPPSVSVTHTVAARPISVPNAATGVSVSRSSDTRQTVSWSASSTSARPISSQVVQRRETGADGSWQSWKNVSGTLSGGARSWADTSTVANKQYQYRVVTRNSAGSTTSSGSVSVRTTPAAPSIGSATKQPDGSVRVSFTPNTPYSDYLTHVLQDNPGGAGWVTVATQAGSGAITHDDPDPSVTHQYRVATRSTYSNPGTLTSAYSSASNIVQLLAPPNAPTRTAPAGTIDRDEPITFEWRHNPVDTTVQSAAQVQYRAAGSGTLIDVAQNLAPNPSFENGVSGWVVHSANAVNLAVTTSFPQMFGPFGGRDGENVAQFASAGSSANFAITFADRVPVTAGRWYAFGCLMATDAGVESQVLLQFYNSAGTFISTVNADSGWVEAPFYAGARFVGAAVAPAGAVSARLVAWARSPGGSGVAPVGARAWVDRVGLVSAGSELVARDLLVAAAGAGGSSVRIPALGVSGQFEWRVRTKGAHPDWSPWSSIGSFTLAAAPTVAINSPDGSDLHESRVTLLIGYDQSDGSPQSRVQAELVYAGVVVETLTWSGTGDTGSFSTALDDDTEYTVRARVQAGNGLWSDWDSVTFTTEFPAPSPVEVVGEWDRDSGAVVLEFEIVDEPAEYRWTGVPGASVSEKVVGGTVVARNLIHNGSFEYVDGSGVPLGWHGNYATIMAPSLSEAGLPGDYFFAPYGGAVGDRLAMAVSQEGEYVYVSNTTPFPVTAGEWVGFGALVATFLEARVRVRFLDDNNAAVGGLAGTEYESAVQPDGTEIIGAAQVPAGATRARVLVYAKENPPYGVIAYIDAVRADTAATETEALNRVLHYFDGDKQEEVGISHITVQRRDHTDAPWITLADHIDPAATLIDPVPALGAPEYRVISHTDLPSSTTGPVSVVPWVHGGSGDPVFVNTGPGYELVGTARGNQASDDYSIEQSSFHAAGIDLPIAIFGTTETGSISFTGRIFDPRIGVEPVTTREEWRALLRHRQVVCYRDCQGRKMFGLLHVSFSQQGPVETVQITVDEVWHEEGAVA